jgi:hypothetical protein
MVALPDTPRKALTDPLSPPSSVSHQGNQGSRARRVAPPMGRDANAVSKHGRALTCGSSMRAPIAVWSRRSQIGRLSVKDARHPRPVAAHRSIRCGRTVALRVTRRVLTELMCGR